MLRTFVVIFMAARAQVRRRMKGGSVYQRRISSTGRRSKSYLQQRHDLKAELRSIEAHLIKTGLLKKDGVSLFNY